MKIAFAIYPSSGWTVGGRERILRDLHDELAAIGVDVELLDPWDWTQRARPDILHVYGSEGYYHELVVRARSWGIRTVVSAVLLHTDARRERLAAAWRHFDRFLPVHTVFGLRRDLLRAADAVICASQDEYNTARRVYGVAADRMHTIPYALAPSVLDGNPDLFASRTGVRDVILSVARIEPRKNQLALATAAAGIDAPLVIIGKPDPMDPGYVAQVERAIRRHPNAQLVTDADDAFVASAYASARVHSLVSHHETLGMVSIEAAAAGANIVTTRLPAVYEYLGDDVWYADPTDTADIQRQLLAALAAPANPRLRERVRADYSVRTVAQQHVALYQQVLETRANDAKG